MNACHMPMMAIVADKGQTQTYGTYVAFAFSHSFCSDGSGVVCGVTPLRSVSLERSTRKL